MLEQRLTICDCESFFYVDDDGLRFLYLFNCFIPKDLRLVVCFRRDEKKSHKFF